MNWFWIIGFIALGILIGIILAAYWLAYQIKR
jgi:hypothetical protein